MCVWRLSNAACWRPIWARLPMSSSSALSSSSLHNYDVLVRRPRNFYRERPLSPSLLSKCVGWVQLIKKLDRIAVGSVIDGRNGLPRGVSHRKHSVSFHQE